MHMLLALAPMRDITVLPFLQALFASGSRPDYLITEYFRSGPGHDLESSRIMDILRHPPGDIPVYVQLVGNDRASLVKDAHYLMDNYAPAGIDLNLGCPTKLVCNKGAGGALLLKLRLLDEILAALRDTLPSGAFSVKCRLGWEDPREFESIMATIARHCPDRLVIHARTVRDMYRGPIHFEWVTKAIHTLPCPVIANGDIIDTRSAQHWIDHVHPAGLMIGRGIIRNPWLFNQIRSHLTNSTIFPIPLRQVYQYVMNIESCFWDQKPLSIDEKKHINSLKKFIIHIVQGFPQEFEYQIRRVSTRSGFETVCRHYLDCEGTLPELVRPYCSRRN